MSSAVASTYKPPLTINGHKIFLHHDDLPEDFQIVGSMAIDTETMGLLHTRDRLCLIQIFSHDRTCHLVKIDKEPKPAPRLTSFLLNDTIEKIFHFARFDLASIYKGLGVMCAGSIFCTKIASKMTRTYTDFHGLRRLCQDLLGTDISKAQQSSDWGAPSLTDAQKIYAASDVIHLYGLRHRFIPLLEREGRKDLFTKACAALPIIAQLDVEGFGNAIFDH